MVNYVKFQRGTITAYENLKSRGGIDNNTLYFIYSQDEPNKGILYMGEKIISSGDITIGVERLSELKDISLDGLSDKVILQYNAASQKWQVVDFKSAAEEAGISGGAIEVKKIELLDGETVAQALARTFPEPKSGNMGIINNIIYFYDGEQWRTLNADSIEIEALKEKVGNKATETSPATGLYKEVGDLEVSLKAYTDNAILQSHHLKYEKVESLDDILNENIIYFVPNGNNDAFNKFDEYMLLNGVKEKIGVLNPVPSSDFITSVDENTFQVIDGNLSLKALNPQLLIPVVGNLDDLDSHKQGEDTTIVDEINNINARLKWQELEGENE